MAAAAAPAPAPHAQQQDKAFEIFIKRAITSIHKESWGRTRDAKEVKDSCQTFLSLLEQHETGTQVYEGSLALAVLQPLLLACASSNAKIVELALGALHKLVAHAWLQGESSNSEDLIADDSDIVTRVIKQVIKCGEVSNPLLQLSVIRALLTFTTAEHFVAHGDSLMSAVRAVFNLALGSESEDIKRTACNALLQILNTVAKRVTAYTHALSVSLTPSRRESEYDGSQPSWTPKDSTSENQQQHQSTSEDGRLLQHAASSNAGGGISRHPSSGYPRTGPVQQQHPAGAQQGAAQAAAAGPQLTPIGSLDGSAPALTPADARTAQLAQLAEQQDIRGLEAALNAPSPLDVSAGGGGAVAGAAAAAPGMPAGSTVRQAVASADGSLGALSVGSSSSGRQGGLALVAVEPARARREEPPAVQLTVIERDVLLVLTAFCKLASREAGLTEVESYLHQGKLLALELLVKVLQNPQHRWENVRDAFTQHLRQPLCITLLRNWAATDPSAFQLAIKLLLAIMMQPRLRAGLKAELSAFYPLFVLVPLEQGVGNGAANAALAAAQGGAASTDDGGGAGGGGAGPGGGGGGGEQTDLHTLYIVLSNLKQLCGDAQLVVDMFVNYDCDVQAPPLFERTLRVLGLVAQRTDVTDRDRAASANQPAAKQQAEALARLAAVREAALRCITAALQSIHAWAAPLREHLLHASPPPPGDANGHNGAPSSPTVRAQEGEAAAAAVAVAEVERLEAVWAHKSTLAKGVTMFNSSPNKGVKFLIQQGLVEKKPQAVAAFLRAHVRELDKVAVGEYLGHHEAFQVSVMHAFVDQERYAGASIDLALRHLLAQFRLPGEAQKIDRIMEKFAERFYLDNPSQFRNADGPYLLSFAIIMLNTDAHNPLAERRLGKPDFVAMCHQTLGEEEGGGMAPVMDPLQLEAIYDRIVAEEISILGPEAKQQQQQGQQRVRAAASASLNRLAVALGLHAFAAPFKPLTRSWGRASQGLPEAERKRGLLELAERAVTRGAGSAWVVATHCELCRPMLTVGATAVLDALAAGLAMAVAPGAADPLVASIVLVAQLAALLRLDEVCERAAGLLATACRVWAPAPPGTVQEAKQLLALKALLGLTGMPDVGSLGSAWAILLRTASALGQLTEELLQPADNTQTPQALPTTHQANANASPFNKMFQAWGISLGGIQPVRELALGGPPKPPSGSAMAGGAADAGAAGAAPPPVKPAPGAALVQWALTEGKPVIEQLFSVGRSLDGEAVVVYFRAMCAVSREELDLPHRPRTAFLQRLVHCSHANADRIRLIWGKLWAIIGSHLVAATCHPVQDVALYAVDALRGLVTRLLSRAELAHFRAQEEALRPFVAVLRQCDDPAVRDAAVAALAQAVAQQSHGLGSGWRTLLEAVTCAGADATEGVVAHSVQVLGLAVRALYAAPAPMGHSYLPECVRAAAAVALNPATAQQTCVAAVHALDTCAAQLAAAGSGAAASRAATGLAEPPGEVGAAVALAGTSSAELAGGVGGAASASDHWTLLLLTCTEVLVKQDARPLVANAAAQVSLSLLAEHSAAARWPDAAWGVLLGPLLSALFHVPLDPLPSSTFAAAATAACHAGAAAAAQGAAWGAAGSGSGGGGVPSAEFVSRAQHYLPAYVEQLGRPLPAAVRAELMWQLASTSLHWMQQRHEPLIKVGLAGYEQLLSHCAASTHDQSGVHDLLGLQQLLARLEPVLQAQLAHVAHATQHLQQAQLAQHLQQYLLVRSGSSSACSHSGAAMLLGGCGDAVAAAGRWAAAAGPLAVAGVGGGAWPAALAAGSHMLLLAHRALARVAGEHRAALPWRVQAQLLQPLLSCARQCAMFNQRLEVEAVCAALVVAAGSGDTPSAAAATALLAQVLSGSNVGTGKATAPAAAGAGAGEGMQGGAAAAAEGAGGASKGAAPVATFSPISPFQQLSHMASFTSSVVTAEVATAAAVGDRQPTDQDEAVADSILEAVTATQAAPAAAQAQLAAGANAARLAAARAAEQPSTHTAAQAAADAVHGSCGGGRSPHAAVGSPPAGGAAAAAAVSAAAPLTLMPGTAHMSLIRLELETARCAMDALEACVEQRRRTRSGGSSKPGPPAALERSALSVGLDAADDVEEKVAEQEGGEGGGAASAWPPDPVAMLRALCSDTIQHSAAALTQSLQLRMGDESVCLLTTSSSALVAGPGGGGRAPVAVGVGGWLEELRAPLVAHAVLVAGSMQGAAELAHVRALFPHLLVVMCSPQAMVREAVAVYFSQVLGPMVMGGEAQATLEQ